MQQTKTTTQHNTTHVPKRANANLIFTVFSSSNFSGQYKISTDTDTYSSVALMTTLNSDLWRCLNCQSLVVPWFQPGGVLKDILDRASLPLVTHFFFSHQNFEPAETKTSRGPILVLLSLFAGHLHPHTPGWTAVSIVHPLLIQQPKHCAS